MSSPRQNLQDPLLSSEHKNVSDVIQNNLIILTSQIDEYVSDTEDDENKNQENKSQNNGEQKIEESDLPQVMSAVFEAVYPLVVAFNAEALTLTVTSLSGTDTDENERHEIQRVMLLMTLLPMMYGLISQLIRQYLSEWVGEKFESFEKTIGALSNGASAFYFTLGVILNAMVEVFTAGKGTDQEVDISYPQYISACVFPAVLGAVQVASELVSDEWTSTKKLKRFVFDPMASISVLAFTIEQIQDWVNYQRSEPLTGMFERYVPSIGIGALMTYLTRHEDENAPAYTSMWRMLIETLSAMCLGTYQFEESKKLLGSTENALLIGLTSTAAATALLSRVYFGKPRKPVSEVKIEEITEEIKRPLSTPTPVRLREFSILNSGNLLMDDQSESEIDISLSNKFSP